MTAEQLTELLQRAGRLAGGSRVAGVTEVSSRSTIISVLKRFRLDYAGEAQGAPAHLLLKTVRTDGMVSLVEQGQRESAAPPRRRGVRTSSRSRRPLPR